MNKRWIGLVGIPALGIAIAVIAVRHGSLRASPQRPATPTAEHRDWRQITNPDLVVLKPPPSPLPRDERNGSDQPPTRYDVGARARRIADSPAFQAFAADAHLDTHQQDSIAHILALHYENDGALVATSTDLEQLKSMQLQLLGDTVAQLRVRIPDSSWDPFVRSGLLTGIASVSDHT